VCDCDVPLSICDSVVTFPMEAATIRCRLRPRDPGKRSSAQTVTLRTKQCRAEPLEIEGPSAGGWDGYLQQIGYAIASTGLIMMSVRPQAGHDNNIVPARQLCI
jgi:hypothetical protein